MSREAFAWAQTSEEQAELLAGDASTRSYYRVRHGEGSAVLMVFDEDELSHKQAERFCQARDWLDGLGIPVPDVLDVSDDKRWQLLQDLGNLSLENWLNCNPSSSDVALSYAALAEYLHKIQNTPAPDWLNDYPSLSRDLLRRELGFFHEHFLGGQDGAHFSSFFDRLAEAAATDAMLPAHRDYHCRNVMLHEYRLYLVDFQDVRYAHPLYDAASLIYDAYNEPGAEAAKAVLSNWKDLADLPAVALQRNLKAVGTFAYQSRVRGKSFYEGFIPRCLALAEDHLRALDWNKEMRLLKRATTST